jgi:hypothetical protein
VAGCASGDLMAILNSLLRWNFTQHRPPLLTTFPIRPSRIKTKALANLYQPAKSRQGGSRQMMRPKWQT